MDNSSKDEGLDRASVTPGELIAGKYRVLRPLGHGSTGTVFLCEHTALEKQVAVKLLHRDLHDNAGLVARFHREAKTAARLDHPSSVHVTDFGEHEDGSLYLAMEYIEGRDLADLLAENWALPDERIVHVMVQVLSALSAAHKLGIVHRDLKPENILVRALDASGRADQVKVCDFGIAQLSPIRLASSSGPAQPMQQRVTGDGMVVGTPSYMSPEQARGHKLDARSDIYSAGVVLFQLLTRTLPFIAETPMGVAVMHCTTPPPPPSGFGRVNPALEAVCLRAMSKTCEARYQTAAEMLAALEAAITRPRAGRSLARRPREPRAVLRIQADERASTPQTLSVALRENTSGGATMPRLGRKLRSRSASLLLAAVACTLLALVAVPRLGSSRRGGPELQASATKVEASIAPGVPLATAPVVPPPTAARPTLLDLPTEPIESANAKAGAVLAIRRNAAPRARQPRRDPGPAVASDAPSVELAASTATPAHENVAARDAAIGVAAPAHENTTAAARGGATGAAPAREGAAVAAAHGGAPTRDGAAVAAATARDAAAVAAAHGGAPARDGATVAAATGRDAAVAALAANARSAATAREPVVATVNPARGTVAAAATGAASAANGREPVVATVNPARGTVAAAATGAVVATPAPTRIAATSALTVARDNAATAMRENTLAASGMGAAAAPLMPATPAPQAPKPSAPPMAAAHVVIVGATRGGSGISNASLRGAVNAAAIDQCYHAALSGGAIAATPAKAQLELVTDMSGRIVAAKVAGSQLPQTLRECIEQSARTGRIRDADTGAVQVTVNLSLEPR